MYRWGYMRECFTLRLGGCSVTCRNHHPCSHQPTLAFFLRHCPSFVCVCLFVCFPPFSMSSKFQPIDQLGKDIAYQSCSETCSTSRISRTQIVSSMNPADDHSTLAEAEASVNDDHEHDNDAVASARGVGSSSGGLVDSVGPGPGRGGRGGGGPVEVGLGRGLELGMSLSPDNGGPILGLDDERLAKIPIFRNKVNSYSVLASRIAAQKEADIFLRNKRRMLKRKGVIMDDDDPGGDGNDAADDVPPPPPPPPPPGASDLVPQQDTDKPEDGNITPRTATTSKKNVDFRAELNRLSADVSRVRRKKYLAELERRVVELESQKSILQSNVQTLEEQKRLKLQGTGHCHTTQLQNIQPLLQQQQQQPATELPLAPKKSQNQTIETQAKK